MTPGMPAPAAAAPPTPTTRGLRWSRLARSLRRLPALRPTAQPTALASRMPTAAARQRLLQAGPRLAASEQHSRAGNNYDSDWRSLLAATSTPPTSRRLQGSSVLTGNTHPICMTKPPSHVYRQPCPQQTPPPNSPTPSFLRPFCYSSSGVHWYIAQERRRGKKWGSVWAAN